MSDANIIEINGAEVNLEDAKAREDIETINTQLGDIAKQVESVGQPTQEQINTAVNNAFSNENIKCNNNYNNPFENLNIVLFGDSISDEYNNITKWVQPFRNLIVCKSLTNYARGNCVFTFRTDSVYNITTKSDSPTGDNIIWNQFNRLKNDVNNGVVNTPDIIMILAGTNDALRGCSVGDVDTAFSPDSQETDIKTLNTLSQTFRYVCDDIYNSYPNCKIIICTPLPIGTKNDYKSSVKIRDGLIKCANILNLDIIDQTYKSGIVWYREVKQNKYYRGDGIHPSDLGGELIANFIYKELLNLPCFYEKTVKSINLSTTESTKTLDSITSTFSQGNNTVYTTDSLDTLKQYLVVKANYSDKTSETITSYTLSGTLATGTSIITVSYNNKTTTFNVIVTEKNTPTTNYTITNNLTNVTNSNSLSSINEGDTYIATITPNEGYNLDTVTVTMGGNDITNTVYSDGSITISNVTGNIIITATASKSTTSTKNYLHDDFFTGDGIGMANDCTNIFNLAIPNSGEVVSFNCKSFSVGKLYFALCTKSDNNFTPFYVKECDLSVGLNYIDINYTPESSINEYYVGVKGAVNQTIGLNTNASSATSTNQQFNECYYLNQSNYVPEVNKVIKTAGINNNTKGMAFNCYLVVKQ